MPSFHCVTLAGVAQACMCVPSFSCDLPMTSNLLSLLPSRQQPASQSLTLSLSPIPQLAAAVGDVFPMLSLGFATLLILTLV